MKLSEIYARLDGLREQAPNESYEEFVARSFRDLPRMPFKELPASLQKEARQRHTPENLLFFLEALYGSYEIPDLAYVGMVEDGEKPNWPPPEPYTPFDSIIEGIPQDDLTKILIRARNTVTYTVEYEWNDGSDSHLAPFIYGDHLKEAFEAALTQYQQQSSEKQNKALNATTQPRHAPDPTEYVSAGFYQYVISDKKYQKALTTQSNNNAYIALMDPDFFNRINFTGGVVTYDQDTPAIIKAYSKGKYTDVKDLDFPLLTQIYTAAVKSKIKSDDYTITVSLPRFCREMGIEGAKGNSKDIVEKLHSFDNCVGIMKGTQVLKLLSIIKLDANNQTMVLAVPYILELAKILEEKNHVEKKTRHGTLLEYPQPHYNKLIHSTIAKERSKTAIELVYLITTGLLQRGYTPDCQTYRKKGAQTQYPDRVTYSTSFRGLINNAPLLRGRIHSYKDVKDKNRALRRAFEKAYQLIAEKTDAAEWFLDLQGNWIIPTMKTLESELIITHNGRNGDYKPKK